MKKMFWFIFFLPSIHWNIYGSRAYGFRTDWNISQSCKVHVTHSNASDWPICKNKQELSDFWAIGCRFVHMSLQLKCILFYVYNIIAICLKGALFNNFERRAGFEPPPPPHKRPCIIIFSFSLCRDHDFIFSWSRHNKSCFLVIMTSEPILSICRIHKLHGAPETPGAPLLPKMFSFWFRFRIWSTAMKRWMIIYCNAMLSPFLRKN